jgi:hypothetical protein
MPIVSASNGVRPEFRALAVIKLNQPVTPTEINDYVGTGDYAAKYISFLRRDGFVFDTTKDGRKIVSYTLIGEPANAEFFRNRQPKAKAAKVTKQPAVDLEALKSFKIKAAAPIKTKKVVSSKPVFDIAQDEVSKTFGSTGEIASSYSVDSDWDSMDGVDARDFLR